MAVARFWIDGTRRTSTGTFSLVPTGTASAGRVVVYPFFKNTGTISGATIDDGSGPVAMVVNQTSASAGQTLGFVSGVVSSGTTATIVFSGSSMGTLELMGGWRLTGADGATPYSYQFDLSGALANSIDSPANGAILGFSSGTAVGTITGLTFDGETANGLLGLYETNFSSNVYASLTTQVVTTNQNIVLQTISFAPGASGDSVTVDKGDLTVSGKTVTEAEATPIGGASLSLTGKAVTEAETTPVGAPSLSLAGKEVTPSDSAADTTVIEPASLVLTGQDLSDSDSEPATSGSGGKSRRSYRRRLPAVLAVEQPQPETQKATANPHAPIARAHVANIDQARSRRLDEISAAVAAYELVEAEEEDDIETLLLLAG